jgi:glycerol-3-phosphate acyltransferase PlsY
VSGSALVLTFAFLLGSVPFGLLVAHVFGGADLRKEGSGNIGATNVSRVLGFWPAGFLTFLLDALKGSVAVLVASGGVFSVSPGWLEFSEQSWQLGSPVLSWTAGFCAVLGHCFSPWLRFNGGKGVATGFGVIAVLSPWSALAGGTAFAVTFLANRMGSLSSLMGLLVVAITHSVLPTTVPGPHLWSGAAILFVVLARHEKNLDALLNGRENQF